MNVLSSKLHPLSCLILLLPLLFAACGAPGKAASAKPSSTTSATSTPVIATDTPALDDTQQVKEIDAYLSHLADTGSFSGSVLLARGNNVLLSKGYGLADEENTIPNTPQTRFRIGSNTKQFTAMAILVLQERGKLHVQDSVCLYVPKCPSDWQPITIHNLLIHSSGIPDYINYPGFIPLIGTPATPEQLVARFKDWSLDFSPGAQWEYSNSNYTLLGYIIERLSGESYAQFLQDTIFGPLHLSSSGFDSNILQPPEHAIGYLKAHDKAAYLDMSEFYAAGALYSTVGDLYTWDQALLSHQLVSQQTMAAMFTPYIPCPSGGCALHSDIGYGYGWFIANESNHRLIYHWGHIDGFFSSNGFYPADHVIVVVLSNLETTDVFGISDQLGRMLVGIH